MKRRLAAILRGCADRLDPQEPVTVPGGYYLSYTNGAAGVTYISSWPNQ